MDRYQLDKPLKIDNRPLWLLVLDRTVRYQVIAVLVLVMTVLFQLTPPEGLSTAGYKSLVLFAAAIFLWWWKWI